MSSLEKMARLIEVVYLPDYGRAAASIDGPMVRRRDVREDLCAIVAAIREEDRVRGSEPTRA